MQSLVRSPVSCVSAMCINVLLPAAAAAAAAAACVLDCLHSMKGLESAEVLGRPAVYARTRHMPCMLVLMANPASNAGCARNACLSLRPNLRAGQGCFAAAWHGMQSIAITLHARHRGCTRPAKGMQTSCRFVVVIS
eukprot:scaffold78616_cov23-Tisochrysis_lutea.AAC.1